MNKMGKIYREHSVIAVPRMESKKTYIAAAGQKGRGVFASQAIASCEVIEVAPVLIINGNLACQLVSASSISEHVYDWSDEDDFGEMEATAIGLGHTSLYNTDDDGDPNATFDIDLSNKTITISALRDIAPGDEITIQYLPDDDLLDSLVEICNNLAAFKREVKKEDGFKKLQEDILKIQESLHDLALDHLGEPQLSDKWQPNYEKK